MTRNSGTAWLSRVTAWATGPRAWPPVLLVGVVGSAVLVTGTVIAWTHTPDVAAADTIVISARDAQLELADGTTRPLARGDQVPRGAEVRTGPAGSAELITAGRASYLGALATLDVLDGARQTLKRGQTMIDSRAGQRLALTTMAGLVAVKPGSLVRVETATSLRLALFDGAADITATGRRGATTVNALHQVQVPYGYVPGAVTPLALTDDAWETRLASDLVSADQDLGHLAASLSGAAAAALLNAVPAAFRTTTAAAGTTSGEQALEAVVAQTATIGLAADRMTDVMTARAQGGSWGVVAALVGSPVTAVSALVDAALAPAGGALLAGGPTVNAGLPSTLFGPTTTTTGTAAGTSDGTRSGGRPSTSATRPAQAGAGAPTSQPSSPPPPLVEGVLTAVLKLMPKPTPPPAATPTQVTPATSVAPSPSPAPLLGIIPLR